MIFSMIFMFILFVHYLPSVLIEPIHQIRERLNLRLNQQPVHFGHRPHIPLDQRIFIKLHLHRCLKLRWTDADILHTDGWREMHGNADGNDLLDRKDDIRAVSEILDRIFRKTGLICKPSDSEAVALHQFNCHVVETLLESGRFLHLCFDLLPEKKTGLCSRAAAFFIDILYAAAAASNGASLLKSTINKAPENTPILCTEHQAAWPL